MPHLRPLGAPTGIRYPSRISRRGSWCREFSLQSIVRALNGFVPSGSLSVPPPNACSPAYDQLINQFPICCQRLLPPTKRLVNCNAVPARPRP